MGGRGSQLYRLPGQQRPGGRIMEGIMNIINYKCDFYTHKILSYWDKIKGNYVNNCV